jgi:Flp pilus assembly protein protease CpaA
MKFETLMLKSLFFACVLAGVLTVGSMLLTKSSAPNVAVSHAALTANSAS